MSDPIDIVERLAGLSAAPGASPPAALAVPDGWAPKVGADLKRAAEFTREDLGPNGTNYPHIRTLLAQSPTGTAAITTTSRLP